MKMPLSETKLLSSILPCMANFQKVIQEATMCNTVLEKVCAAGKIFEAKVCSEPYLFNHFMNLYTNK